MKVSDFIEIISKKLCFSLLHCLTVSLTSYCVSCLRLIYIFVTLTFKWTHIYCDTEKNLSRLKELKLSTVFPYEIYSATKYYQSNKLLYKLYSAIFYIILSKRRTYTRTGAICQHIQKIKFFGKLCVWHLFEVITVVRVYLHNITCTRSFLFTKFFIVYKLIQCYIGTIERHGNVRKRFSIPTCTHDNISLESFEIVLLPRGEQHYFRTTSYFVGLYCGVMCTGSGNFK